MPKRTDISSILALGAAVLTAACEHSAEPQEDAPQTINFADGFQQSDADAILQKCDAKDISLTISETGEVQFYPSPNADYDASVCVLEYIKKSGTSKFGFVGNERYTTSEKEE